MNLVDYDNERIIDSVIDTNLLSKNGSLLRILAAIKNEKNILNYLFASADS